jgi:hypothetical protein
MSDKEIIRYVTDEPKFARDASNMALINTDKNAYTLFKARRSDTDKAKQLHHDVEQLKSDIGEIKSMLQNLARG